MRHPIEFFDTEILALMASALDAAEQTARLVGDCPASSVRMAMARRVIRAASSGEHSRLALTEAALDGPWG